MTIYRALGFVDRANQRDDSPLRVVMATEGRKADGIDLRMSGARLERYKANPVLGYGHRYYTREDLPIGRITPDSIEVFGTSMAGDLDFDQSDDFATTIERKMRDGYISAVSIGFDVLDWESENDSIWRGGVATGWELTETSVVPIGMDDKALVTAGRGLVDDTDRAFMRALVAEFGAERILAALTAGPPPQLPAPPVQDPTPVASAGVTVPTDAARALLAAFAKESR